MPTSTRKTLISLALQALDKLDVLEEILYDMDFRAEGRQPVITKMTPVLLQGTEALRQLWTILKEQL